MGSGANQYTRQVLHHTDPPPPIQARFFYSSLIPIDDPLSPVPPAGYAKAANHHKPKPFSAYDNSALDKAWHELRRKILQYHEERGEKAGSAEGSRVRGASRGGTEAKRASGSMSRSRARARARPTPSALKEVEAPTDPDTELPPAASGTDTPQSATELPQQSTTTGTPFIRAPARRLSELHRPPPPPPTPLPARPPIHQRDTYSWDDASHLVEHSPAPEKRQQQHDDSPKAQVPVGVSRLHQVEMPELVMQPIYWTPVHDTAEVLRGTWFYKDTMMPVETHVANMLEAGYVELQVWTETWRDELKSAIEVGASGEEKIMHKLWPDTPRRVSDSRPPSVRNALGRDDLRRAATFNSITAEPETPEMLREKAVEAACDIIDISTGPGGADNKAVGKSRYGNAGATRNYATCGVIYANEREARILKPSLMPSSYYGRRPLANYIRKGHKLGIPVVRGFDEAAWLQMYPPKRSNKAEKAEHGVATSASGAPPKRRRRSDPELAKAERPVVSDLVFVIHGIGQKLSQRMESFHFTHAMNAFRRDVHVEAGTPEVKARFRNDMGGIMVLPVNWRHSLSFEEGGYRDGPLDASANEFSLQDITPDTLPSVRNIVGDVMLDIPYYMSHHQPKMIAAVIREANRVYQLWCQNNPGFAQHGRVHIIGHSLGSVMSIDILSRQPTTIPEHLRDPTKVNLLDETIDHFLFNTSNLFLAGSPAGFFLLLRRAQLLPRIDYKAAEPEADPTANTTEVCGERGKYGCLAVENLYNIINGYDPVSYRMNAAVDAAYATSIKKAFIPASTPGWFTSQSSSTSWFAGNPAASSSSAASNYNRAPPLPRLPSNVELDIHDFTREEIAERRMYLLNDNGQIDFFLRYGGGPLEIQYLTMLGAHSSYWLLKDFTRMVVMEVGRERGREGTRFGMRAVKRKQRGG